MTAKQLSLAVALGIVCTQLVACTSLFFQPSHTRYPFLELDRLSAQVQSLQSKDGTRLSAWILKGIAPTKGVALQFHGNAENMSSHYRFMTWLLDRGWDVLAFDYRGYGESEGSPANLDGVRDDGVAALKWAESYRPDLPLVVFGQSLGGNISVSALAELKPQNLRGLVLDSTFESFQSIAKEKLSEIWFLWPLQPLAYVLVSNDLAASTAIDRNRATFKQIPCLFLHSRNDPVVSFNQGQALFDLYPGPKGQLLTSMPGHVNAMFDSTVNPALVQFLETQKLPDNKEVR